MPPYCYAVAVTDDSLGIFDLEDPLVPILAGSLQGAGAPNFLNGAFRLRVYGNYAYIALNGGAGLTIIDISDPANPVYAGGIYGAGAPNFLGACQGLCIGNGTFNGYAYMCSVLDDGLTIIDITDPTNPVRVGGIYGIGAPNFLNGAIGVDVVGDYAYCVTLLDNSFTIINVSDPTNPTLVASIQGAGAPPWLGQARQVRVSGNYAYVVAALDDALTVIDITDPAAPAYFGGIRGAGAPNFLDNASDLFLFGNIVYMGGTFDDSLSIFDITNPAAPVFLGNILDGGAVLLNAPIGVTISGSLALVAAQASNVVTLIDISNPAAPIRLSDIGGGGAPNWMLGVRDVKMPLVFPPIVQTRYATEQLGGMALYSTLQDDGGRVCEFRFEYGTTPAMGSFTPWKGGASTGDTLSQTLAGLLGSTIYYFRAQARNITGTISSGSMLSFITAKTIPSAAVSALPASGITNSKATLNGMVDNDGGQAGAVRFEYGLSNEYGMATPWQYGFVTGDSFSADIIGLAEGSAYHYRAQFLGPPVSSRDMGFSTLSPEGGLTLIGDEIIELLRSAV